MKKNLRENIPKNIKRIDQAIMNRNKTKKKKKRLKVIILASIACHLKIL